MYSFREAVKEEEVGMEVGGENMTLLCFSGSHHKHLPVKTLTNGNVIIYACVCV